MKVHRVVVPEPIHDQTSVTALCGAEVRNPLLLLDVDGDLQNPDVVNAIGNCTKCLKLALDGMYIYGVIDGSKLRGHDESE